MIRHFALAFAALTLVAGPGAAEAQRSRRAAAVDWTTRIVQTPEGGYRMGNPNARMKLVEYGSISCSHCADFEKEQGQAIRDQVRTGRVSWEYRPYLIFPSDTGIFMLLRCQPASGFFRNIKALYETQSDWIGRIETRERTTGRSLAGTEILEAGGLDRYFRAQGITNTRMASCLGNSAAFSALVNGNEAAVARGVTGTPSFFLNGNRLDVATFAEVTAALGRP